MEFKCSCKVDDRNSPSHILYSHAKWRGIKDVTIVKTLISNMMQDDKKSAESIGTYMIVRGENSLFICQILAEIEMPE